MPARKLTGVYVVSTPNPFAQGNSLVATAFGSVTALNTVYLSAQDGETLDEIKARACAGFPVGVVLAIIDTNKVDVITVAATPEDGGALPGAPAEES